MSLQVGFIGAGGIARAHLGNLRRMEDVTVRGVADVNDASAQQAAADWNAKAYTDCGAMLEAEQFDAVYVCLPPGMHGSLELGLAQDGIPFYVEKPLHLDLVVAAEVRKAIRERGLITSVGYQMRYSGAVRAAHEYLADRQLTLASGCFLTGLPGAPWWRVKALSGGQVVEQSTHTVDMLRYLAGEVETVYAFASNGALSDVPDCDIDDASVALLEFAGGAVGQVTSTCVLTDGGDRKVALRLDGRSFSIHLTADSLVIADEAGRREESYPEPEGGWMAHADRTFLDAVRSGDGGAILSDYGDSLQTLAVTLAVEQSLATAEPVSPSRLLLQSCH